MPVSFRNPGSLLFCVLAMVQAATAADAPTGRVLLQPPAVEIASPITDRFALRGVYYRNTVATGVRYDREPGTPGTLLDVEDELGLAGNRSMGSLDLSFRMLERHRIGADFSRLTRHGDTLLGRDVEFGRDTFPAGARVTSSMSLRKLGLRYTYSVLRREQVEIGLGAGLHLLQLDGVLEAPAIFQRERLDTAGPFPTLVADVTWRMTPRFSLNAAAQWLDARIDDVDGGYTSWHADVQYRAWRNVAFGIGYTHVRYRVDSERDDFAGYFSLRHSGPEAFVRVSF